MLSRLAHAWMRSGRNRTPRGAATTHTRPATITVVVVSLVGSTAFGGSTSDEPLTTDQVVGMSLEDLMDLDVTSVAGTQTEWFTTPAAVSVITGDEVRRSGFRTLAEALRLAPGVFVGHSNSRAFSVGMRGFNGSLGNKTLVLIDGRAVYDPLFGGTAWDVQDVLLEDLDRIEVIRGPGATLWGANAVNGVINVITKSAKDTQGLFVAGGGGTYERAFGEARYGVQISDHSWLRLYGKWFQRDHLVDSNGESTHDDWAMLRGGFRFDREGDSGIKLTIQGDAYGSNQFGQFARNVPVPGQSLRFADDVRDVRASGANVLMRIGQDDADNGWSFQAYYDRTDRVSNVNFQVNRDTFDAEWRHYFTLGQSHRIMWGLGARYTRDHTEDGPTLAFDPSDGDNTILSAFIQDTITLVPDHLFFMIGSKVSHNDYTGVDFQPSARIWWTPDERNTLWASVSRPVRIPSRIEDGGTIISGYVDSGLLAGGSPNGTIIPLKVDPNDSLKAEQLTAYEIGYRVRINDQFSVDAAAFYNDYERLIYVTGFQPWNNDGFGETYGGEAAVTWRPTANWRLEAAYSYTRVLIHGPVLATDEGLTPRHQAQLRSYLDITDNLELNSALYFVDDVPAVGASSYWRFDVGVTWRVTPNFEMAIWGQNLVEPRHREFSGDEVERGVYIMGTIRF